MSFWKRLWGKKNDSTPANASERDSDAPPAAPPASSAPEPSKADLQEEKDLARLRLLGDAAGPSTSEALAMLRARTGTLRQAGAVEALVVGLKRLKASDESSDALRIAVATLLDEAGEAHRAILLIRESHSAAARMFCADLHARDGQLPQALSLIERVLAQAIDLPGARERRDRWAEQLGIQARTTPTPAAVTVLTASTESHSLRLLREAARGGAATIYEAEDEVLGRRVAYKVYHRGADDREQITREARTCHRFAGRGVVRIFDAHPEEGWLAMEWVRGGSLHRPAGNLEPAALVDGWLDDVLIALNRLHTADYVHGDLKPANILLKSADSALLSDFGICSAVGTPSLAGTPGYISPERLAGAPAATADDVYALGRILEDRLRDSRENSIAIGKQRRQTLEDLANRCLAPATERPPHAGAILSRLRSVQDASDILG